MNIYCMSDIHGYLAEFNEALELVLPHLEEDDTMLILLGDYIHGPDSYGVLDRIMALQEEWGTEKVLALAGNHEDMAVEGRWTIPWNNQDEYEERYHNWMMKLPRYHTEGNTIFVHAGIEEEAEELWEWGTNEYTYTEKFPAQLGHFYGDLKIVAGHVGTAQISGDSRFHDIYFDGYSHYYIDGTVQSSHYIPVLKVDTDTDKYYRVTESGDWLILPYEEEN